MADQFLKDLLQTPGTSGVEQGVQNVVRAFAAEFAADVSTDVERDDGNPAQSPWH